ncbi:MAG: glutamate-1-semialdehyde 2,1-aminomutase [Candidatus Bathyarchaeota archaeon]|uniref:glutamate-1-semialdehyde 2,1-aminomutase n=1 Tax=Candidatus Bathycorpusculum sp. TaxID=2994959 RepID=UPI0028303CD4|nr:glutamate-1-semialdehyde 2,1-aminomutase [Candidatus Termiticorpusculum sp.]MCL2257027.1 glutamate-1-semialdehyde 2,1-aminomutase [Candidatus Termiticorpusculum sp.]MCL2292848.1 glutamate-1-semialdehyde 2,1-aminomutase [Candidatus Termiticorpusculum sp.]
MSKSNSSCSLALFERAKKILPGGVNSPVRAFVPYPFFVKRAMGSKLFDADGHVYIDYCNAYGAMLFGHAYPDVMEAVKTQLANGTLYGVPTEQEVVFAELIKQASPCMEMLRLVNTGTEATMHAVRVARGYTGRRKIVKFEGCFHGSHDNVLVKAGSGAATFGVPNSLGIPDETTRNTIVLPYNDIAAVEAVLEQEGNEVAAIIVEPVLANVGLILPKTNYLAALRKLTVKYGVVLIFDEIITGFRLALGGAQEYFNITPDMATLGKVLGGGFPVAAFGGKAEIMQTVSPVGGVYQAGTFSGNPVSTIAGSTMLCLLLQKRNELYPQLEKTACELSKALVDLSKNYKLPTQICNIASLYQIFFTDQPVTDYACAKFSNIKMFNAYFHELLKHGVFIPPSQFETCFTSIAHSSKDISGTIEVFDKALAVASKVE